MLVRITYATITVSKSDWLITTNVYFLLTFQVHRRPALVLLSRMQAEGIDPLWDITGVRSEEKEQDWDHALHLKTSASKLNQNLWGSGSVQIQQSPSRGFWSTLRFENHFSKACISCKPEDGHRSLLKSMVVFKLLILKPGEKKGQILKKEGTRYWYRLGPSAHCYCHFFEGTLFLGKAASCPDMYLQLLFYTAFFFKCWCEN